MAENIISFSLYGNDPTYTIGAIENARLTPTVYPGWTMRVYYGLEVDQNIINQLQGLRCETVLMPHDINMQPSPLIGKVSRFGKFWRFLAIADPLAKYVILRDCDSRLNCRELAAAAAWVHSGKILHIMKDHINHGRFPILAGMWGIMARSVDIIKALQTWQYSGDWYDDQVFLEAAIWPQVKHSVLFHGRFGEPFPPHPPFVGFVGQRMAHNNIPLHE